MGDLTTTETTIANQQRTGMLLTTTWGGDNCATSGARGSACNGLYRGRSGVGGSANSEAYNERVSVEYTCRAPSSRSGMYQRPATTDGVPLPALLAVPPRELGMGESRPEERASTDCTTTAEGATERWWSAVTNVHGAAVAPFGCDSLSDLKWSTQRWPLQKGSESRTSEVR